MSPLIPTLGEHCNSCFSLLKGLESCPRSHIFQTGEVMEVTLEVLWVISSALPFLICAAIAIHAFTKKTSRGFLILTNILIQQIMCAVLKKFIAQHRPEGACSTTYGYPSSHSGFTASLAVWLILEAKLLHDKAHFKSSWDYAHMRNAFVSLAPLIPISRYFLNYHSLEQIAVGLIVGTMVTVPYFIVMTNILSHNGSRSVYGKMFLKTLKRYSFEENFLVKHYAKKEEDF